MEGIKHQKLPLALWNLDRIDKQGSALNSTYRRVCCSPCIANRSFYAYTSLSQRRSCRGVISLEVKPEEAILLVTAMQLAQPVLGDHGPKAGTRQGLKAIWSETPHGAQSLISSNVSAGNFQTWDSGFLHETLHSIGTEKEQSPAIPSTQSQ